MTWNLILAEKKPRSEGKTANELEYLCTGLAEDKSLNEAPVRNQSRCRMIYRKNDEREGEGDVENELCPLAGVDEAASSKEAEIRVLKVRISRLEGVVNTGTIPPIVLPSPATTVGVGEVARALEAPKRRGKAPTVSEFTGDPENILDDRRLSLERICQWDAWKAEEKLMQFAGHLHGRVWQEWNLLLDDKRTFETADKSVCGRINT